MSTPIDDLANHHDGTLVGENYFSYMLGLRMLAGGQRVLLIDDERVAYGNEFNRYLFDVDKYFLKSWGGIYKVDPLKNINEYLSDGKYFLTLGERNLLLGRAAADNYRELQRKLPELFPDYLELDEFTIEKIDYYVEKLANNSLQFKSFANFENEIFEEQLGEEIQTIIDYSYQALTQPKEIAKKEEYFRALLRYSLNGMYYQRIQSEISKVEWTHMFFYLIGKRYQVNIERLNTDLGAIFKDRGGILKKTKVEQWQVYKGKSTCLQLASFEGVIKPGRVFLMGRPILDIPLEMNAGKQTYLSYNLKLELKNDEKIPDDLLVHYVFSYDSLGKNVPFFVCYPHATGLQVSFPYPDAKGSKASFYLPQILKLVDSWLGKVGRSLNMDDFAKEVGVGPGFNDWYSLSAGKGIKSILKFSDKKPCYFTDANTIESSDRIKNIQYWGPMQGYSLGRSSFYMDLKSSIYGTD